MVTETDSGCEEDENHAVGGGGVPLSRRARNHNTTLGTGLRKGPQ